MKRISFFLLFLGTVSTVIHSANSIDSWPKIAFRNGRYEDIFIGISDSVDEFDRQECQVFINKLKVRFKAVHHILN